MFEPFDGWISAVRRLMEKALRAKGEIQIANVLTYGFRSDFFFQFAFDVFQFEFDIGDQSTDALVTLQIAHDVHPS